MILRVGRLLLNKCPRCGGEMERVFCLMGKYTVTAILFVIYAVGRLVYRLYKVWRDNNENDQRTR
jgi:hypothetical protein